MPLTPKQNIILQGEIALPAYDGMADSQIKDVLNLVNIPANQNTISGDDVLAGTDWGEYGNLSDLKKTQWLSFTSTDDIDATKAALNIVRDIFGIDSQTETNLLALRQIIISKATELGLPVIDVSDVTFARTGGY